MNQIFKTSSSLILTTLILLCIYLTGEIDAGKGKVPIYMPIPIPIPMPMSPSGGGPKFHHHQQQRHGDDEDGEVKKIYLLQPMPKVQPPPQQKGGFPVQTHIHMPPPIVQKPQNHHGGGQSSYGDTHGSNQGGGYNQQHHESSNGHGGKTYTDMKILPIVVIPPIAPMPPIHVASGNSNSHAPKMTLTPQFNNYVVSSSTEPGHKSVRSVHRHFGSSYSGFPQDDKSFSDYGGSVGGSIYKETYGPRARSSAARARLSGRRPDSQRQEHLGLASKSHRYEDSRELDLLGDDEEHGLNRRLSASQRGRHSGQANRYREPSSSRSRSSNSIRDIINSQQPLFDDENLDSLGGSGSDSVDPAGKSSRLQPDCCNEKRSRPNQSTGDAYLNADTEQREVAALFDREYPEHQRESLSRSRHHQDLMSEEIEAEERHRQVAELNNAYYDRDLIEESRRHSGDRRRASNSRLPNGRRLYLDEREILDDDEWWFDTIKSVSHVSPPSNNTITSKATNSTTITTPTNNLTINLSKNSTTKPPNRPKLT